MSSSEFDARLRKLERQMKTRTLYNAPANPQVVNGYHVFLTGDVLYWKAAENGLTYALKVKNPIDFSQGKIHFKDPHFQWDVGFRAGIGFNLPHDHWDLSVNWTAFYPSAHGKANAHSNEGLFPVFAIPFGPLGDQFVSQAKVHWKLNLDIIDVELGKEYYVGKQLALRPYLDVRTVFVNQKLKTTYETPPLLEDHVNMKNRYWGVGPRAGLNFQWWLWRGWSFYGNGAISLVYGNNSIRQREEETVSGMPPLQLHEHMRASRFIADLGLFFGWDGMFSHDTTHIGFKGGWEQMLFFEQNQFVRFADPFFEGSIISNQGNLMLQGWTFSVRLDF